MPYRVVEFHGKKEHRDDILALADMDAVVRDWRIDVLKTTFSHAFLIHTENVQSLTDKMQVHLSKTGAERVVILPVEAVLPRDEVDNGDAPPGDGKNGQSKILPGISREELYEDVSRGVTADMTFFLLVVLSTIVAAIGLLEDNIAVVIGAMVIAPLLGPNMALALASVLGDRVLMKRALKTNASGFGVTFALSYLIGMFWPYALASEEILSRTDVGYDGIVLAVASGAAAVLSISRGVSSALVGVMVAVALLPPAAAMGILAGAGQMSLAFGAMLLLMVNVVSVNLAAKLVFISRGVQPRTWYKQKKAKEARKWYLRFWVINLLLLAAIIYVRQHRDFFFSLLSGG